MADRAVFANKIIFEKDSRRPYSPELHGHEVQLPGSGPSSSESCTVCAGPVNVGVPASDLVQLLSDGHPEDLKKWGGVKGPATQLHSDTESRPDGTDEQMHKSRGAYESTAYPEKVKRGFWSSIWDARKETTLNLLMLCASVSLDTGIWTKGTKEGWHEGISIGATVFLENVIKAASEYKQRLNFQNLNGSAILIGKAGLVVASSVLIIFIISYNNTPSGRDSSATQNIQVILHIFPIAVLIVVVAVMLILAHSVRKMMNDKSLVRVSAACETQRSAVTICSDKTGTLIRNKMTDTRACVGGERKGGNSLGLESLAVNLRNFHVHSVCLNSTGDVSPIKDGEEPAVMGSPKSSLHNLGVRAWQGLQSSQARESGPTCRDLQLGEQTCGSCVPVD